MLVKRYNLEQGNEYSDPYYNEPAYMEENSNGEYVKYSDYAKVKETLDRAISLLEYLHLTHPEAGELECSINYIKDKL